jgi:hypothetical protein
MLHVKDNKQRYIFDLHFKLCGWTFQLFQNYRS